MKKSLKPLTLTVILLGLIVFTQMTVAQSPPHPPSDKGTGINQGQGPSGAPIDGGTGIFLLLAVGYGLKKVYGLKRNQPEDL